jgi:hypothetical protein
MGTPSASNCYERLSPGARALIGFLQPAGGSAAAADVRDLSPQAWDETLAIALRHGVAPLLHRALQSGGALAGLPDYVRARLEEERRATALVNLRNLGQFWRIARALRERKIPLIALKGLHVAELVYRDISLRPMSDLDILVPRSQLEQAVATLHGLDYGFDEDVSSAANAMLDTKCNVGLAHRHMDVWLEVHWSLSEPPERYTAALEDIWRSAVPARLGDADALVMSPEFLLLHICAHLACNHLFVFSLRALCDIAEIVRAHPELDWTVVVNHGRRHGWGRGVGAALRLASDHLGAGVPVDTLASLEADALDPGMLAEAMEHLVTCIDMPDELRTAPNLMAFAGEYGPLKKVAALWARIFVPRPELALLYGVPESSARLALYYAVRLRDLLRRYAASAWALNVSDPKLAAAAARHARLARWINDV